MKKNTSVDTTSTANESLAEIYGFLALTMRYPDSSLHDDAFFDALEKLLDALDLAKERDEIHNWRTQDNQRIDTLQVEYTRLFINGIPHLIAPPYGSFYLDGDRNLQGKSTERTRDFYRQFGYDITDTTEPADHIRIELEFLSALVRDNQLDAEENFLHTILRPWYKSFSTKVTEADAHPFYTTSLQIINFFITNDSSPPAD